MTKPPNQMKPPRAQRPETPSLRPSSDRARQTKKNALDGQRAPAPDSTTFGARINRRAADRLRSGHLWVYASDVEAIETGQGDPPALLPVADNRGLLLGTALYSPASQIALRMVSREAIGEAEWLELFEKRLRSAIERRLPLLKSSEADSDSCRLCFSEADELPGLIIDKYGDLAIVQLLARGLDSAAVRQRVVAVTRSLLQPTAIWERPDPRIRELEGLAPPQLEPLFAADPGLPMTANQFRLNGLRFQYDVNSGQKTGAFLDQRANYKAAQDHARRLTPGGRALDVCTYQGGFALHLARVCRAVTGIDASRSSLEVAEKNLAGNREQLSAPVEWVEGDAFQILRDWSEAGEKFNAIVLDPPAFAKTKRAVEGALRGYKELNLRALKMLEPGGLLLTCSCSHHVSWTDLEGAVASAAADANRRVRLLERRGAAPDHPVVLNLPETEYLKCLVLEVD
ncbi:MAG TPA: class I SAM-dependent rRNA methyltransferase [Terracidiphilus sp.]|nr:class I SAM-dependent rRNA methyltransferase [Terracidiphilus sp.]